MLLRPTKCWSEYTFNLRQSMNLDFHFFLHRSWKFVTVKTSKYWQAIAAREISWKRIISFRPQAIRILDGWPFRNGDMIKFCFGTSSHDNSLSLGCLNIGPPSLTLTKCKVFPMKNVILIQGAAVHLWYIMMAFVSVEIVKLWALKLSHFAVSRLAAPLQSALAESS